MSVTVDLDGDQSQLASANGLKAAAEWAEGTRWPAVRTFFLEGEWEGTDELRRQLRRALVDRPPSSSVRSTAEALLLFIGVGDSEEVARIVE
jgi:hypothetical protein